MKRAARALLVLALASAGSIEPLDPGRPQTAAEAARRWIHPKAVTHVWYHFEFDDTHQLPRHMYVPPPRDIDVTYRDLDTGKLRTERGVDADWLVVFRNPELDRARIEAVAHAGGYAWCILEVWNNDGSGWTVSDSGRRRCRVKRRI